MVLDKSKKLKENEFNRTLRQQLSDEKRQFEQKASEINRELQRRAEYLSAFENADPVLLKTSVLFRGDFLRYT